MPEPLEQLAMEWPDEDQSHDAASSLPPIAPASPMQPSPELATELAPHQEPEAARQAEALLSSPAVPVLGSSAVPVLVATDGSCLRNPGGATGWAWVRSDGAWAYGGRPEGTNQIGELLAVVLALTDHPDVELEIQCDSSYAIGCATTWKKGWQRNNYINSQKKIVSNLEIIRELHRLIDARSAPLTLTKVKGHDLSNRWPLNTAVDVICGNAAAATQLAGIDVNDSGTIHINWEPKTFRSRG